METLKYKVISSKKQYYEYCRKHHDLVFSENNSQETEDEIELLYVLIKYYDEEHSTLKNIEIDPIQLLESFMEDHDMKAKDLVKLLGVSKGYVSEILNYKKGLSKEVIRKLAERFKVRQEAFNKPYKLVQPRKKPKPRAKPTRIVSTRKKLRKAI